MRRDSTANFYKILRRADTAIPDSGATGFYYAKDAPVVNIRKNDKSVTVGTASKERHTSTTTAQHAIPDLPADFPRTGHVMEAFEDTLMGLGPICDAGCTVTFDANAVTIRDRSRRIILCGWRDKTAPRLWRISLLPSRAAIPHHDADATASPLTAYSAYDLPSVEALVRYFHACAGFPTKRTWLAAIKAGNFNSWPGLTYNNAARYCPSAVETLKGHLVQGRKNVRSTRPKLAPVPEDRAHLDTSAPRQDAAVADPAVQPPTAPTQSQNPQSPNPAPVVNLPYLDPSPLLPQVKTSELHVRVTHMSRLYTDDTGRFPIRSRSGNQYIMVAYHCDSNAILACPFKTRKDAHRMEAYNSIMEHIQAKGFNVDLQILDNEASAEYKKLITEKWGAKFQLVPPNMHRRNAAERAIRTFKAHFLAILAGVAPDFPRYLWDLLIPQAQMTLNFLRQATLNPKISAHEFFSGPFNFDVTPLGPMGCKVIAHLNPDV